MRGTYFETNPFHVEGNAVVFSPDTANQSRIRFNPQRRQWCFENRRVAPGAPAQGCITVEGDGRERRYFLDGQRIENFVMMDAQNRPAAELEIEGREMKIIPYINGERQRQMAPLFFRITDQSTSDQEELGIRGNICFNDRFSGCAGTSLVSRREWKQGGNQRILQGTPHAGAAGSVPSVDLAEPGKSWISENCQPARPRPERRADPVIKAPERTST